MHEAATLVPIETRTSPISSAASPSQVRSRPLASEDEDGVPSEGYRAIDRIREARSAEATGGLSQGTLALALFDWSIHLGSAPGKRMELIDKAARKMSRVLAYMAAASTEADTPPCVEPLPGDYRFRAEGWPATLDAAALTVMAARGQITGAKVDGPLAFDNAINPDAARKKGIVSSVAGYADILLVPDLEAGNMLAKQLIYFADATAAGLVLGARVPIVLTSRADPLTARIASAALAKLLMAPQPVKGLPPS